MIKALFYILIILLAAIGLVFLMHQDPGYAVIAYHHWVIATSFWVALATILITFLLLYCLIRLCKNIMALPKVISRARQLSHAKHYQEITSSAMMAFVMANYAGAEKLFVKSAKQADAPAACYLMAAEAAHLQNKIKTRDLYLEKAKENGADVTQVYFLSTTSLN